MNKRNRQKKGNLKKNTGQNRRYPKLLSEARQKLDAGQLSSALDVSMELVTLEPSLSQAWHLLGATCYCMADMEKACEAFERAVSLDESNFSYINDLGGIYLEHARFAEAEDAFRKALKLEPRSVEARYNLATCLSGLGRFEHAIPLLQSVISESPDLVEPKFNLGLALRMMGKPEQAVPWLEQTVSESLPMAQLELARCYRDSRNWEKATAAYALVNQNIINEQIASEHAETIYLNGNTESAISYLQNARKRFHKSSHHLELLLADIYLNSGELVSAKKLVESIIAAEDSECYLGAVNLRLRMESSAKLDEGIRDKLLRHLGSSKENLTQAVGLNFTIGKLYDNAKNFDEAQSHYIEANQLKHQSISYDATRTEELAGNIIEVFSHEKPLLADKNLSVVSAKKTIQPVFIVGLPRSGTTLVEQMLGAHSGVHNAGELGFFSKTASKLKEMFETQEGYPRGLGELSFDQLEKIRRSYVSVLKRHSIDKQLVTDKMPENFLHIGFIRLLFPRAPIIHVARELEDVAISTYIQNFEQGNRYAFAMEDIAHYFIHYKRIMDFWNSLPASRIFHIQYENLVKEPDTHGRALLDYLDLPWESTCLEFYRNKGDVRTASNWQVRQPLYDSSVGRAHNYPLLKSMFERAMSEQEQLLA